MMSSFLSSEYIIKNGNICCCCLGNDNLQSLVRPDCNNVDTTIYSDMIYKCYGIRMIAENDDPIKYSYFICDTCLIRLKNAFSFRLQIEMSYESLQKYFIHKSLDLPCKSESTFDKSENNFNNDSYNYPTNIKTEDTSDSFISGDFKIDIKHNEIPIEESNAICENIDIKLEKNSTISNVVLQTSRQNKIKNSKTFIKTKSSLTKTTKTKPVKMKITDEKPFKLDESDLTCKICNETFVWHNSLKRHMSIHFPNHICDVCGKFCVTKKSFQSHVRSHINTDKRTCEVCNKSCDARNFHLHMRNHSDAKINKCPQCPERFKTFREKIKHLIDVHNDEPNKYKCKLCPKRYLMPGLLKNHIRNSHYHERNHECAECSQRFFYPRDLRNHMLTHSGLKNFQCEVCKKCFAKRYTLNEHMKIHNNIKNFVCQICSRAFIQKCTLKVHIKTHEKDKPSESELT